MGDEKRTISVEICGKEYDLLLTVGAIRSILQKFGSLDDISDKLNDPNEAIDAAIFLLVELINGAIERQNALRLVSSPLVTERDICALASLSDFPKYAEKITEAMSAGMRRNIESEDAQKNAQAAP
jgi:hypothetical protein